MSKAQDSWNETYEKLRFLMLKEISVMRDILANMHQEELSILLNDKPLWEQVMQDRYAMVERLSDVRLNRLQMTKKLEKLSSLKDQQPSLEEQRLLKEKNDCEILNLRDQIMALLERMNFQQARNHLLSDQRKYEIELTKIDNYKKDLKAPKKKKNAIATYPTKE